MFKFQKSTLVAGIVGFVVALLILIGTLANAEVTTNFWKKVGSGSEIWTNVAGSASGEATIHVGGCVIEPAGTPCAGSGAGVTGVSGTDPITVDNSTPSAPIVGLSLITDSTLIGNGSTSSPLSVVGGSLTAVLPAKVATTTVLPGSPTYANGTGGVGATLTRTGNGALGTINGVTLIVGDRVLVKNQAAQLQNGIYQVSALGSAGAPYVLTRTTDSDATSEFTGQQVSVTNFVTVNNVGIYGQTTALVTVGTNNVVYAGPTGLYVTQLPTGGQINGAIPTWTGVGKELRKSGPDFFYDVNQFTMNGQDPTGTGAVYRQINASQNNLGAAGNGLSLYAGDDLGPASATNGATVKAEKTSGNRWVVESHAFTPTFDVLDTLSGSAGQAFRTVTKVSNGQYSQLAQTDTAASLLADSATGTNIPTVTVDAANKRAYIANLAATNRAIDILLSPPGSHQQTAFNVDPGLFTPTSTVSVNGSEATNVTYIAVAGTYTVDSNDPLIPDNIIVCDTDTAAGSIRVAIPAANSYPGRTIGILNSSITNPVRYAVGVIFTGGDFFNNSSLDYIMASPMEVKYYKSVLNNGDYHWEVVKHVPPTNFHKSFDYGVTVDVTNGVDLTLGAFATDRASFGFGSTGGSGASTILLPLTGVMRVGQELIIFDDGLNAGANNTTIDAGSGNRIISDVAAQTLDIIKDGGSYTLRLISDDGSNTTWKVI